MACGACRQADEPGSDPRLLVNIFGCNEMVNEHDKSNIATLRMLLGIKRKRQQCGVGKTRVKLAKIVSDCLGLDCHPEDLQAARGAWRTDKRLDVYAWEVTTNRRGSGMPFWAGCFDTMTDCVKAGFVHLHDGEIYAGKSPGE